MLKAVLKKPLELFLGKEKAYVLYLTALFLKEFGPITSLVFFSKVLSSKKIISIKKLKKLVYVRNTFSDIYTLFQNLALKELSISYGFQVESFLDLGSNIGLQSVYMKNRFPNCKIIAVEVDKGNFSMVKKNLGKFTDVTLYNKGVWSKDTFLEITNSSADNNSFIVKESKKGIPSITINSILKEQKLSSIDVIKIDIEGSEKEVFSKNTAWIKKAKILLIETHDRIVPGTEKFIINVLKKSHTLSRSGEFLVFKQKN